jgi:hypothetical protein
MQFVGESSIQEVVESVVLDSEFDAASTTNNGFHALSSEHQQSLLALRGLLVYDMLGSVLKQRPMVEYGPDLKRGKQTAVPYRASGEPSARSEFSDADRVLLTTHIAYYTVGLSQLAIQEAVARLLKKTKPQQETLYGRWYRLGEPGFNDKQKELSSHQRLDCYNKIQLETLHEMYRFNIEAINFWLSEVVLPRDVSQFGYRMTATAWDTTNCTEQMGFSGTNDTNMLIPHAVNPYQFDPQDDSDLIAVRDTDVNMKDCLLKYTAETVLEVADTDVQMSILTTAIEQKADTLIDAGALLAGKLSFTDCIASLLQQQDKKVVYSKSKSGRRVWHVQDRSGSDIPLDRSPTRERDCLAVYDQYQCRGADLKLKQEAVALLTIGPGLRRDQLMQAAGRLRQLGRGQRVIFVTTHAVAAKVREINGLAPDARLSPENILLYCVCNTAVAFERGLGLWAQQGTAFEATKLNPEVSSVSFVVHCSDS